LNSDALLGIFIGGIIGFASGIGTDIIKRWLTRPRIFVCEESVQVEFNYPVSKKASEYDQISFCL
jgi:hypothetical protein